MKFLIIEYNDKSADKKPEIIETRIVDEKGMWLYLQEETGKKKFTVNKIECVLDFS